jgi:hypothetical protein
MVAMKSTVLLVLLAALAAGCHDTSTTTSPSTPVTFTGSDIFLGTISPMGSDLRTFEVGTSATVALTIVSLTDNGTNAPINVPLTLLLGSFQSGSTCSGTTTATAVPALAAQITQSLLPGTFCFMLTDPGSLAGAATYGVRVVQTINPTTVGSAGTTTFASNVYPTGISTRTFAASANGQITVRMDQLAPSVPVGLALGVPGGGSDCSRFMAVTTQPGVVPELSAPADAGTYCVQVYDTGQVTTRTQFDVQIAHP